MRLEQSGELMLEGESVLLQYIPETVVLQLPTLHPHLHPWFSMGLLLIISVKWGIHSWGILSPSLLLVMLIIISIYTLYHTPSPPGHGAFVL